jgi:hypothetical protein
MSESLAVFAMAALEVCLVGLIAACRKLETSK